MPVPKRKTSKKRKNQRASTKFIRTKSFTECSNCKSPLNSHAACSVCGFYKGKKVMKTKLDRMLMRGQAKEAAYKKAHAAHQHEQSTEPTEESQNVQKDEE